MKTIDEAPLSQEDLELSLRVREIVHGRFPDARIILYGSTARGTRGADSDYDFLILTLTRLDDMQRYSIYETLCDVECETGAEISLVFETLSDWDSHPQMPFHLEVKRDGIPL